MGESQTSVSFSISPGAITMTLTTTSNWLAGAAYGMGCLAIIAVVKIVTGGSAHKED